MICQTFYTKRIPITANCTNTNKINCLCRNTGLLHKLGYTKIRPDSVLHVATEHLLVTLSDSYKVSSKFVITLCLLYEYSGTRWSCWQDIMCSSVIGISIITRVHMLPTGYWPLSVTLVYRVIPDNSQVLSLSQRCALSGVWPKWEGFPYPFLLIHTSQVLNTASYYA